MWRRSGTSNGLGLLRPSKISPFPISSTLPSQALPSEQHPARYPNLDLIRGIAACAVAVCHGRNLFFQDYDSVQSPGTLCKSFYLMSGLGHQAVIVFFVLSGFVICNSIHSSRHRGTWSWRAYLISRLTRLWVVLIPAIILGFALDKIGSSTVDNGGIYRVPGFGHVLSGVEPDRLRFAVVAGNLLFLQTILVPPVGSNSPLWSLANEFWYYVSFPLFWMAFRQGQTVHRRFLLAAAGLLVLAFAGVGISSYFCIWLLGCGAFYGTALGRARSQKDSLSVFSIGCMATIALLLISRRLHTGALAAFGLDFLLGVAVAVTLLGAANLKPFGGQSFFSRIGFALAKPSYSLYVLHLPLLVFVASRLFRTNTDRWPPDIRHFSYALAIITCCFVYVLLFYRLTEAKTDWVRGWFFERYLRSQPNARPELQKGFLVTERVSREMLGSPAEFTSLRYSEKVSETFRTDRDR
jgi:peptidoglycan/LPS O-acetylase OafA/YrhL